MKSNQKILHRGGEDTERLYLSSLSFKMQSGERVVVQKTRSSLKDYSMKDHLARHKGRYSLVGLFARPDKKILDFPCGSGYASDFLKEFDLDYTGLDNDPPTIAYANKVYGNKKTFFSLGNLEKPTLKKESYDIVACIEGIEHINGKFQKVLVKELAKATKKGGVLIISSPENPTGKSGPSKHNKDHLWELTKKDFLNIIYGIFDKKDVDVVTQESILSTGIKTNCLYAICHKK